MSIFDNPRITATNRMVLLLLGSLLFAWQPQAAADAPLSPNFMSSSESVVTSATGDDITIDIRPDTVINDLLISFAASGSVSILARTRS